MSSAPPPSNVEKTSAGFCALSIVTKASHGQSSTASTASIGDPLNVNTPVASLNAGGGAWLPARRDHGTLRIAAQLLVVIGSEPASFQRRPDP
jgi:hypothetical protein